MYIASISYKVADNEYKDLDVLCTAGTYLGAFNQVLQVLGLVESSEEVVNTIKEESIQSIGLYRISEEEKLLPFIATSLGKPYMLFSFLGRKVRYDADSGTKTVIKSYRVDGNKINVYQNTSTGEVSLYYM
jgi:hypothetical protein